MVEGTLWGLNYFSLMPIAAFFLSVRFPQLDSSHKRNIGLFYWSEFYLVLKPAR